MKAPFKHFDLPKQHLTGETHYVPPKARQSEEVERRRSLPHGTLLAEQQLRGIRIAKSIIDTVTEKPDLEFSATIIAASGLNSAWYGYARQSPVMRRRLLLPILAAEGDTPPPTSSEQMLRTRTVFADADIAASGLLSAIEYRSKRVLQHKIILGRTLGNAALSLACVEPDQSFSAQSDPHAVQTVVRERGLLTLEQARTLGDQIGTPPTLAQLADMDSDLSVYIRRSAPNGVFEAFQAASELHSSNPQR